MAWNPLEHLKPVPFKTRYRPPKLSKKLSVPYAICGAHAVIPHLPERETYSLDVLINQSDRETAQLELAKHSSHQDSFSHTHDFFILKRTKQYICLINDNEPWTQKAIDEAQSNLINNEPTIPFHWLTLSKIINGSRQDFLDCSRLIVRASEQQLSQTKLTLESILPSGIPELRKLYQVGRAELKQNPKYINKANTFSAWYTMNAEVDTKE